MVHVFFMGVIVSMYKLSSLADMTIDGGLFSLVLLLICSTLVSVTMDEHSIWEELEKSLEQ
jgi:paraquat-inducible protein A